MDLITGLKSEVFRPLATLVVPGTAALAPYLCVATEKNPGLITLFEQHPNLVGTGIAFLILAVGFFLEDLGSRIESGVWDERLEARTGCQQSDWKNYLKLSWKIGEEPIAQRYLRTV